MKKTEMLYVCVEEILKRELTPSEKLVLCFLLAKGQIRINKKEIITISCRISYDQIADGTTLSKKAVQIAVKNLVENEMLICTKKEKPFLYELTINCQNHKDFGKTGKVIFVSCPVSKSSDFLGRKIQRNAQEDGKCAFFANNEILCKRLLDSRKRSYNKFLLIKKYDVLVINEFSPGKVARETFDIFRNRIAERKETYFIFRGGKERFMSCYATNHPNYDSFIENVWESGIHETDWGLAEELWMC